MSTLPRILVAAVLCLAPMAFLSAQEVDEVQNRRIEALERELADLRRRIDSLAAAGVDTTGVGELRRQLDAVTRQIEALQLGQDVVVAGEGRMGLGPAASKVYETRHGVSIGGYGEAVYQNFDATLDNGDPATAQDRADFLRAVLYVGYKFSDRTLFNSEIEIEHGSTDLGGSVSVEFAYLEHRLDDAFGVRGGMLLVPMGFLNELHEPPIFLSTARPETEQAIIPSTWREVGVGVFGAARGLSYRAYVLNGLDGSSAGSASGFSAGGLRGGRQKGAQAVAENLAVVGRVDYVGTLGLTAGASIYVGNSGQGVDDPSSPGGTVGARTTIWEAHGHFQREGLWLRGLAAVATVDDVPALNDVLGLTGDESVGERLVGYHVEGGYNVLRHARTEQQLLPFVRYEKVNTQDEVPDGFAADPATDREIVTLGAVWKPITPLALKADYQLRSNGAGTGLDQWNLGVGYLF